MYLSYLFTVMSSYKDSTICRLVKVVLFMSFMLWAFPMASANAQQPAAPAPAADEAARPRQKSNKNSADQHNDYANAGQNKVNVEQWRELISKWSAASPEELIRVGKRVDQLHLEIGPWPDGQIPDPDSTSNFLTSDYFPNVAAGFVYWKAAHLLAISGRDDESRPLYSKASYGLLPVIARVGEGDYYKLPAIQLIYVASSLRSEQYSQDLLSSLNTLAKWRSDHAAQAEARIPAMIVKEEWPDRERIERTKLDNVDLKSVPKILSSKRKLFEAEARLRAKTDRKWRQKAFERIELGQMRTRNGQGIPELLANRLVEAESDALDDIEHALLALKEPIPKGIVSAIGNSISGKVKYPFPLEISPRDSRNQILGPTALDVKEEPFQLQLDRPGDAKEFQLAWSVSDQARTVLTNFGASYLGRYPVRLQQTAANHYPITASGATGTASPVIAYQTDMPADAAWLAMSEATDPEDRKPISIRVATTRAQHIQYWLTHDGSDSPVPGTRMEAQRENPHGDDRRFLIAIDKAPLSIGQYHLHLRLTEEQYPEDKNWVESVVPQPIGVVDSRVAFVVGIENYVQSGMRLKFAASDASDFCAAVRTYGGFCPQNIVYAYGRNGASVGEESVETNVPESQGIGGVTSELFQRAFSRFMAIAKARHAKFIIIYYSGHGTQEDNYNSVLCQDLTSIKISQLLFDLTTYMGLDTNGRKCTMVGLYDACRTKEETFRPTPITFARTPKVVYAPIYSCDAGESSVEADTSNGIPIKHGLFTYALLKQLRTPLPNLKIVDLLEGVAGTMSDQSLLAGIVKDERKSASDGPAHSTAHRQHLRLNYTRIGTPADVRVAREEGLKVFIFGQQPEPRKRR